MIPNRITFQHLDASYEYDPPGDKPRRVTLEEQCLVYTELRLHDRFATPGDILIAEEPRGMPRIYVALPFQRWYVAPRSHARYLAESERFEHETYIWVHMPRTLRLAVACRAAVDALMEARQLLANDINEHRRSSASSDDDKDALAAMQSEIELYDAELSFYRKLEATVRFRLRADEAQAQARLPPSQQRQTTPEARLMAELQRLVVALSSMLQCNSQMVGNTLLTLALRYMPLANIERWVQVQYQESRGANAQTSAITQPMSMPTETATSSERAVRKILLTQDDE